MPSKKEITDVLSEFGELIYCEEKQILSGEIFLAKNDSYEVRIEIAWFPNNFPPVFEIGDRIPMKTDRHKYSNSDQCCLTTEAKAAILLRTEINSLLEFLQKIVVPYFENNSYYELNGEYMFDEYSHGIMGIFEGYEDILGTKNTPSIIKTLVDRIEGIKIRPNDRCFCESGSKLKKCKGGIHSKLYRNFKLIPKGILISDLEKFKDAYEASKAVSR